MYQPSDHPNYCLHDRLCSNLRIERVDFESQAVLPSNTTTSLISASFTTATTNPTKSTVLVADQNAPDAPTTTNAFADTIPPSNDEDSGPVPPQYDRTFTSHIGLVGHLQIHQTLPSSDDNRFGEWFGPENENKK
ncbi:hypothetical protein SprV_0301024800 [Sparganum proliferum]